MPLAKKEIERIEEEERVRAEARLKYTNESKKIKCPKCGSLKIKNLNNYFIQGLVVMIIAITLLASSSPENIAFAIIGSLLMLLSIGLWIAGSLSLNRKKRQCESCDCVFFTDAKGLIIDDYLEKEEKSKPKNDSEIVKREEGIVIKVIYWLLAIFCALIAWIIIGGIWYVSIPAIIIFSSIKVIKKDSNGKYRIEHVKLLNWLKSILNIKHSPSFGQMFAFGLIAILSATIICAVIIYWHYSIPVFLILWVWIKSKWYKNSKIIATCCLSLIIIAMPFLINYLERPAAISMLSPNDGYSIQSDKTTIEGKVDPSSATVKINDILIPVSNGSFKYEVTLPNEENNFTVYAINKKLESTAISKTIKIKRIFTDSEIEAKKQAEEDAKIKAEAEAKVAEEAKAKIEAEDKIRLQQYEAEEAAREKEKQVALSSMKKTYDDVYKVTDYSDYSSPSSHNTKNVRLYIRKFDDGNTFLRLVISYSAHEWLFVKKYIFTVDGKNHEFTPANVSSDNYDTIWEWSDDAIKSNTGIITDGYLAIMAIANSKEAKIRYVGSQYISDRNITASEKTAINNVLTVYETLKR